MYEIDGVPLSDPQGRWRLHRETQRRTPVTMRAVDVVIPGVDGSLPIYGEPIEQAVLGLEINVYGSPAEVEDRCNFLRGLLAKSHGPLVVTRRDGKTTEAKLATLSDPVMTPAYARISATLTIPSGVWRGRDLIWAAPEPAGAHEVTTLAGGTRAVTDALVLIDGPATAVSLTDTHSGSVLAFTAEIPGDQSLIVRSGEHIAHLHPNAGWGTRSNTQARYIEATGPRSDTAWWMLTPQALPTGTTATHIAIAVEGSSDRTRVQIRARTAHL